MPNIHKIKRRLTLCEAQREIAQIFTVIKQSFSFRSFGETRNVGAYLSDDFHIVWVEASVVVNSISQSVGSCFPAFDTLLYDVLIEL